MDLKKNSKIYNISPKIFFKEMSKEVHDPAGLVFIEKLINFNNSRQTALRESAIQTFDTV